MALHRMSVSSSQASERSNRASVLLPRTTMKDGEEKDERQSQGAYALRRPLCLADNCDAQSSSFSGEMFFASAHLLWLLSPFLYVNELTKLRLLSKSLNCRRGLTLRRIRWMMCNSVAMVFPGQWELPGHQCTAHTHHCASSEDASPLHSQPSDEHVPPETLSIRRRQKQEGARDTQRRLQEDATQRGLQQDDMQQQQEQPQQQRQQQREEHRQTLLGNGEQEKEAKQQPSGLERGTLQEHSKETEQAWVTQEEKKQQQQQAGQQKGERGRGSKESSREEVQQHELHELHAEQQQQSVEALLDTKHLRRKPGSRDRPCYGVDGSLQSLREKHKRRETLTVPGAAAETRAAYLRRMGGKDGSSRIYEEGPRFSNFLKAVLLRSPFSCGCGALQLRRLTLHLPESQDTVLSLPQFMTYKNLLEVCSPTLEELCLIDFCSFYVVVDVIPAVREMLEKPVPSGAAIARSGSTPAGGPSLDARRDLRRALAAVKSAFLPLSEQPLPYEEDEVAGGETASSTSPSPSAEAVAAARARQSNADVSTPTVQTCGASGAGDSAPGSRRPSLRNEHQQSEAPHLPEPSQQLTLSFKVWSSCRRSVDMDSTDDDEITSIGYVPEESTDCNADLVTKTEMEGAEKEPRAWIANSYEENTSSPAEAASTIGHSVVSVPPVRGTTGTLCVDACSAVLDTPTSPHAADTTCEAPSRATEAEEAVGRGTAAMSPLGAATAGPLLESSRGVFFNVRRADERRPTEGSGSSEAAAAAGASTIFPDTQGFATSGDGDKDDKKCFAAAAEPCAVSSECGDLKNPSSAATASVSGVTSALMESDTGRQNIHVGSLSVRSASSRIPTGSDVYRLVEETVKRLRLKCCFSRLKRVHIYGSSEWKVPRPYFSCFACLFLQRGSKDQWNLPESTCNAGEHLGPDSQSTGRSSRDCLRSPRRTGNTSESCGDSVSEGRRSTERRSRSSCRRRRRGRSQTRRHETISSTGSDSAMERHSSSPPSSRHSQATSPENTSERSATSGSQDRNRRGQRNLGGSSRKNHLRRSKERCSSAEQRKKDGTVTSKEEKEEVDNVAVAAGASATTGGADEANCSPASSSDCIVAGGGGGRGTGNGKEAQAGSRVSKSTLSLPKLEELWWLDTSCVEEDLSDFLVMSKSRRLKKLSFSTYSPSTISRLLVDFVAHPRLFRKLRELTIDGVDFIWTDDEWWWFSGNSHTRFVEIWRLHAMNRYHLARAYSVPRTLQQLEAQQRQQEQHRCCLQMHAASGVYRQRGGHVHAERHRSDPVCEHRRPNRRTGHGRSSPRRRRSFASTSVPKLLLHCKVFEEEKKVEDHGVEEREKVLVKPARSYAAERSHENPSDRVTAEESRYIAEPRRLCREVVEEFTETKCRERTWEQLERLVEPVVCWSEFEDRHKQCGVRAGRRRWLRRCCIDRWSSSTEDQYTGEEEEGDSKKEGEAALPLGFVGGGEEVDYKGIKKALDILPRIRKIRLLSFTGDALGGPEESTHILGSFFPEADLEVQGLVCVKRRVLQRLLMKAVHRSNAVKRCWDRQTSAGQSARRESKLFFDKRTTSAGPTGRPLCSGRVDGATQKHRWRGRFFLRTSFSSESGVEADSSDASHSDPILDFPAPSALSCAPDERGMRSSRSLAEMPITDRTEDATSEWRRLNSEAVRLHPVGQEYLLRWLRRGLVSRLTMTLAIQWAARTELRLDAFHRECISVYIQDILASLPHYWRSDTTAGRPTHRNGLRILELTDCIQETGKSPEGYEDAHGFFIPYGRVNEVLAYFTPFLLGLNCFSPRLPLPLGDTDIEGSQEDNTRSSGDETEREGVHHGGGDGDGTEAREVRTAYAQTDQTFSQGSCKDGNDRQKVLQRRKTVHLDHDLVQSVPVVPCQEQQRSMASHPPHNPSVEQGGVAGAGAASETCRRLPVRVTAPDLHAGILNGSATVASAEQCEGNAGSEGLPSAEAACTANSRNTADRLVTPTVISAPSDIVCTCRDTVTSDKVTSPGRDESQKSLRILRLKGVVGLALPLYTRFEDYRKLGDIVWRVARVYRAQTRVLLVTDCTLIYYRYNKTHHDVAVASLARDFMAVSRECRGALQVIDYRVFRPISWRYELGESQEHACMPSFLQIFLRRNPQFRLMRRLDCIHPVDNEVEHHLQRVKTALTAYIWIKRC